MIGNEPVYICFVPLLEILNYSYLSAKIVVLSALPLSFCILCILSELMHFLNLRTINSTFFKFETCSIFSHKSQNTFTLLVYFLQSKKMAYLCCTYCKGRFSA